LKSKFQFVEVKQLVNYLRVILSGKEILLLDEFFSTIDKNYIKYLEKIYGI